VGANGNKEKMDGGKHHPDEFSIKAAALCGLASRSL